MSVAAVILAAGASSRLGRPKQHLVLNGETLLHRAIRVAKEALLSPVIVVVREPGYAEEPPAEGVIIVLNPEADEGMASSVRLGIHVARKERGDGAVLLTCDQPGVDAAHLRALFAQPGSITGSGYAGRVGVPAYFPASAFPALLELRGDTGARELLRGARTISFEALSMDIDTEEDYGAAQKLFRR